MAKTDTTRDYYADLELPFGAAEIDIKKQFKKLALKYHPDRNPGHEAEVNSKFQTIQAAHEVLIDPDQRAKYDAARLKNVTGTRHSAYGSSSAGFTSGMRGNPYSNAGSQWAPPPRPPPPRDFERKRAPPTSSGAQRWTNFPTPNGATPRPNVDAESRRQTFEGWERMRSQQARAQASQKPIPKEYASHSGREESNNFKHAPPTKSPKPGYEEFRPGTTAQSPRTSPSRTWSSSSATRKNGFMPGTPGGDEPPAANTSAYFNYRSRKSSTSKQNPPDPPPRNAVPIDPLRQFREKGRAPFEERHSTPYTTHGGEKTNPFETISISRSKSTRGRHDKANSPTAGRHSRRGSNDRPRSASPPRQRHQHQHSPECNIPRADSDANLNTSPKRTFSSVNRDAKLGEHKEQPTPPKFPPEVPNGSRESSSENKHVPASTHSYSDPDQASNGGGKGDPKMYSIPSRIPSHSKTSDFPSLNKVTILPTGVAEPSKAPRRKVSTCPCPSATVSSEASSKALPDNSQSRVTEWPTDSPSGVSFLTPLNALNPFEAEQFKLIEQLVGRCNLAGRSDKVPDGKPSNTTPFLEQAFSAPPEVNQTLTRDQSSKIPRFNPFFSISATCYFSTERGSPCKRLRLTGSNYCASHLIISGNLGFKENIPVNIADKPSAPRFSFNADQPYFPPASKPSNSAENISTTFTSEDWKGKFEAGDLFGAGKAVNGTHARPGSRTRTRTASPTKRPSSRPQGPSTPINESHGLRESKSADAPIMSPSGTKFNAEEWAKSFKPQTFAPPSFPTAPTLARPTRPVRRPSRAGSTVGKGTCGSKNASSTTINEDDSSDEAGLYMGKGIKSNGTMEEPPAAAPSPNAMDVDPPLDETPKPPKNAEGRSSTLGKGPNGARNVPLEPSRPEWRAGVVNGASSHSPSTSPKQPGLPPRQPGASKPRRRVTRSTDSEEFKTNFEELKNVEPLHSPAAGLDSFSDLASNLPFQSKASTSLPFPPNFSTGKLELPNPPRAPTIPPIAPNTKRPSGSSWQSFLAAFTGYMAQWNIFNAKMVNHFIGRQNQVAALPSAWLEAFGNGPIEMYKEGLRQDEEVRKWWDVALSKHQQAVEDFQWYRECMREGVQKAGPPSKGRKVA